MPFLPPGAPAAQVDAFAQRLTHHLAPASARAALMPFQDALARAAGYPHAHAWHQRLRRGTAHDRLPALYGAHPQRLASWGKALWKQHPDWRTRVHPPLTGDEVKTALAQVWGWPSWAEFQEGLAQAADGVTRALGTPWTPWVTAPSVADLPMRVAPRRFHPGHRNSPVVEGLHLAVGTDPQGQWVGWGIEAAKWSHPVVRGGDAALRRRLTQHWATERLVQGDTVWLAVAGSQAEALTHLRDRAMAHGRGRDLHLYDYRQPGQPLPRLTFSAGELTQITLQQALVHRTMGDEPSMGALVALLSVLALGFRATLPEAPVNEWLRWVEAPWAHVDRLRAQRGSLPSHLRTALDALDTDAFQWEAPAFLAGLAQLRTWADSVWTHLSASPVVDPPQAGAVVGTVLPDAGPVMGWVAWVWQSALGGFMGRAAHRETTVTMVSLDLPLGWGWKNAVTPASGGPLAVWIQVIPLALDGVTFPVATWADSLHLDLGATPEATARLSHPEQAPVLLRLALPEADGP
jgi:hypothetical protein